MPCRCSRWARNMPAGPAPTIATSVRKPGPSRNVAFLDARLALGGCGRKWTKRRKIWIIGRPRSTLAPVQGPGLSLSASGAGHGNRPPGRCSEKLLPQCSGGILRLVEPASLQLGNQQADSVFEAFGQKRIGKVEAVNAGLLRPVM